MLIKYISNIINLINPIKDIVINIHLLYQVISFITNRGTPAIARKLAQLLAPTILQSPWRMRFGERWIIMVKYNGLGWCIYMYIYTLYIYAGWYDGWYDG